MAATATMSGAQFDALPYEEGRRWELINGELIAVPSPTPRHQGIVNRTLFALRDHWTAYNPSGLFYTDVEFALTDDDRVRPDVCVLLAEKAGQLDLDRIPIPGSPDIAIEVISPSERAVDSHAKVRRYLATGTLEVWQFYPTTQSVQVHRGGISIHLGPDDLITTELLPGLSIPVSSLFE